MANITFSESSGLQDSIFGKSQGAIRMLVEQHAEDFEKKNILKRVFNMGKSTNWGEKFTSMTSMDGFQPVGENGMAPRDGMEEGYSKFLEHMTWKDEFPVTREMIDDLEKKNTINLQKEPKAFVQGYYRTREQFGAALLGGGFGAENAVEFKGRKFDVTCADGKRFFATDHPCKKKKSFVQSNLFSNEFSNDALIAAECAMHDYRGDSADDILDVAPDTIIIPGNVPSLLKNVFAAIGAEKIPGTAENGFNFTYGRWNVIVWNYLNKYVTAKNRPWILMDSQYNETYGSAVWLDRVELDINSYVENGNDANVWHGYSRFIAGFNDWRAFSVGGINGGTALSVE